MLNAQTKDVNKVPQTMSIKVTVKDQFFNVAILVRS